MAEAQSDYGRCESPVQAIEAKNLQFRSEVSAKIFVSARHLPKLSVYASDIMYRMGWTDERMDDFAKHVDQRFDAVAQRFDVVDQRFDRLEGDMRELRRDVNVRFESLQRTLLLTGGGIIATLIAGIISLLVTQL
jgi:hypothetical protein